MRDTTWEKFRDRAAPDITDIIYDETYTDTDGENYFVEGGYDASQRIIEYLKQFTIWSDE